MGKRNPPGGRAGPSHTCYLSARGATLSDSNRRRSRGKPKKPREDFPLGIHRGTGYWCRKVRGRVYCFGKVLRKLGVKRPRLGFYGLRHGFETVAGETADQMAVDYLMGHKPKGMSGVYRERIGNDRLTGDGETVISGIAVTG